MNHRGEGVDVRPKRKGEGVDVRPRRIGFGAAILVLAVSLSPPVHSFADELFSAHMVQHLVLVFGASLLFAWSVEIALPRFLMKPLVVLGLHTLALWVWHLPAFYDAAIGSIFLHVLEHASFFVTGYLFWVVVLGRTGADRLRRLALVFGTALQSGALGAVIAFAGEPLYTSHLATTYKHGLTPLEDQQLAGAIMWVPPGAVYLIVMIVLLYGAFRSYEGVERVVGEP